ncbi:HAD family hydrolase [Streptomyces sp. O3]
MAGRLLIFDCDGVLVDSERLSAQVLSAMAGDLDLVFTENEALSFLRGRKVAEWVAELGDVSGRPVPDDFIPAFRRRAAERFAEALRPVPGVAEVLRDLTLPHCVASSAPLEKIHQTLGLTGLLPLFEGRIHSAYEVGSWKPDPGLFLHAARVMGAAPQDCAVIEDSVVGVRAGVAAGMTVFGYAPPGSGMAPLLRDAGAVPFPVMARLPELIDRWAARPATAVTAAHG